MRSEKKYRQIFQSSFRLIVCLHAMLWITSIVSEARVSNVSARQIENVKLVEIFYDLDLEEPLSTTISVEATTDGISWEKLNTVVGDVGVNVTGGTGKRIIWDAGNDWPSLFFPKVKFRIIIASERSLQGFVFIPPGNFLMGSPENDIGRQDNETLHQVTLTRSFFLKQTEMTWEEWNIVREWGLKNGYTDLPPGLNGYLDSKGHVSGQHPVTLVNWHDTVKWLNAKSEMESLSPCYTIEGLIFKTGIDDPECNFDANGYRLPTEAEWEYACRAGTTTAFYTGEITQTAISPVDPNLDLAGWYGGNTNNSTQPIRGKKANAWGLYDMHGNVEEWCWDGYGIYDGDIIDPEGSISRSLRVIRGGSWASAALHCRSAARTSRRSYQGGHSGYRGFRPARTATHFENNMSPIADAGETISKVDIEGDGVEIVTLDGSQSNDSDGQIVSWIWSWGGNSFVGEEVEATFPIGESIVSLFVIDDRGATAMDEVTIKVYNQKTIPVGVELITAGTFNMGSPIDELGRSDDESLHEVTLTNDYFMSKTEVTFKEWEEVRDWAVSNGYIDLPIGSAGHFPLMSLNKNEPLTNVDWFDVLKWLNAKSEMENRIPCYTFDGKIYKEGKHVPDCDFQASGYRLPTEAEWEYACRSGTDTAFYTGDITYLTSRPLDPKLDLAGWYDGNNGGVTQPVGQKFPNAWGLYDMHGNVHEWCWDIYGPYDGDVTDPQGAVSGDLRVMRDGYFGSGPGTCRSAKRWGVQPGDFYAMQYIGFRYVRTVTEDSDPRNTLLKAATFSSLGPDTTVLSAVNSFDLSGSVWSGERVATLGSGVAGGSFDPITGDIYYINGNSQSIFRYDNLTGQNITVLSGVGGQDVLIDSTGKNILWTSDAVGKKFIGQSTIGESGFTELISNVDGPTHIEEYEGRIYWTDNRRGTIESAKLDGSDRKVLLENLTKPIGLAIDSINQRIYWTDGITFEIKSANILTGSGSTTLTTFDSLPYGIEIDYANSLLYIAMNDEGQVVEYDLNSSSKRVVAENLGQIRDVELFWSAEEGTTKTVELTYVGPPSFLYEQKGNLNHDGSIGEDVPMRMSVKFKIPLHLNIIEETEQSRSILMSDLVQFDFEWGNYSVTDKIPLKVVHFIDADIVRFDLHYDMEPNSFVGTLFEGSQPISDFSMFPFINDMEMGIRIADQGATFENMWEKIESGAIGSVSSTINWALRREGGAGDEVIGEIDAHSRSSPFQNNSNGWSLKYY